MMRPPMSRVETPQLVAQAYSSLFCSFWNFTSNALAKFWPEEVARAGLQRLAVLHHRLDAERVDRAGELLPVALRARPAPASPSTPRRTAVDVEHLQRLLLGLLLRGVGGVAFLPEELGRAQEQPRAHLPADDVAPLVDEQRQVAVALDPVLVGVPDDRLGRRPDDQLLFELRPRDRRAAACPCSALRR